MNCIERDKLSIWFHSLLLTNCNPELRYRRSFAILLDQADPMMSIFEQSGGERAVLESIGFKNIEVTTTTSAVMITGTFGE